MLETFLRDWKSPSNPVFAFPCVCEICGAPHTGKRSEDSTAFPPVGVRALEAAAFTSRVFPYKQETLKTPKFPFLSHFSTPYICFPRITSKINHFSTNVCLTVCYWGNPNYDTYEEHPSNYENYIHSLEEKKLVFLDKVLHKMSVHAKSVQSCPTLCDHMDCSLPSSSLHGIL